MSAAWCVWNNLLPALLSQRLQPGVRAELFGSRDVVSGNSTRPRGRLARVDGGHVLSGTWSLVSGAPSATQFALLAVVTDGDGAPHEVAPGVPETRLAFVSAADAQILDTWSAGGLRGTGSHDIAIDGLFVHFIGPAPGAMGPLDHLPLMAFMTAGAATMLLALARVCCDSLATIALEHVPTDGRPHASLRPAVLQGLARAAANVDTSRRSLRAAVRALSAASGDGDVPVRCRAEVFGAVDLAGRLGLDAIRSLHELGGPASVYDSAVGTGASRRPRHGPAHRLRQRLDGAGRQGAPRPRRHQPMF